MNQEAFLKPNTMSDENFDLLHEALEFLTPKQRLVVYLRFWDCMTIQEIARYVGQSWDSTDAMIDSAVNHLRVRIIQLGHRREERDLMWPYERIAA